MIWGKFLEGLFDIHAERRPFPGFDWWTYQFSNLPVDNAMAEGLAERY
jgi:hypothetical protein